MTTDKKVLFRLLMFTMRATNAAVGNITDPKASLKAISKIREVANGETILFEPTTVDNRAELIAWDRDSAACILEIIEEIAKTDQSEK